MPSEKREGRHGDLHGRWNESMGGHDYAQRWLRVQHHRWPWLDAQGAMGSEACTLPEGVSHVSHVSHGTSLVCASSCTRRQEVHLQHYKRQLQTSPYHCDYDPKPHRYHGLVRNSISYFTTYAIVGASISYNDACEYRYRLVHAERPKAHRHRQSSSTFHSSYGCVGCRPTILLYKPASHAVSRNLC